MTSTKSGAPPSVAEATLRYYRCSPQKARLVVDQIRGKNVNQALGLLRFSPKGSSRAIEKLLRSAVANAEHAAEKVDVDTLRVGEVFVGPGPTYKRFRGRAFGRAFRILHRTCHITLRLSAPGYVEEPKMEPLPDAVEAETPPAAKSAAGGKKGTAAKGRKTGSPARKRKAPAGRKRAAGGKKA